MINKCENSVISGYTYLPVKTVMDRSYIFIKCGKVVRITIKDIIDVTVCPNGDHDIITNTGRNIHIVADWVGYEDTASKR